MRQALECCHRGWGVSRHHRRRRRRPGDRDAPVPAGHRPRVEGHGVRRRARPHRRAAHRRLVHGGQDRDRSADHAQAAARADQRGVRPDARAASRSAPSSSTAREDAGRASRLRRAPGLLRARQRRLRRADALRRSTCRRPRRPARPCPRSTSCAGLTCTEETFAIKAGAQRVAAALGLALVTCDTSPRATRLPGDDDGVGLRPRRRLLPRRHRGAVVVGLPHAQLRRPGAAGAGRARTSRSPPGRAASSATRWAATARWCWRCATPIATAASRRSRRSARRARCRGDRRRSAATSAPIAQPGPPTTLSPCSATRRFPGTLLVDQGTRDKFLVEQLRPELLARCLRRRRPAARAAPARRLRPQLLLRRELRRGAPAPSRARAAMMTSL